MKELEKVAYHLFVRGVFSKQAIKNHIRQGHINYYGYYLYDPVERELSSIKSLIKSSGRGGGWEYENWEQDFAPKERAIKEFLDIFESRAQERDAMEYNPANTQKPKIIELAQLRREVRGAIDKGRFIFHKAFSVLIPVFGDWRDAANKLFAMQPKDLNWAILDAITTENGNFGVLWDFLSFSGYLMSEYAGPVVNAYRQLLRGAPRERLGQLEWTLEHKEFLDAWILVRCQMLIGGVFAGLIRKKSPVYERKLEREPHPEAFRVSALYASALRFQREGALPLTSEERSPALEDPFLLATPSAWGCLHLLDEAAASLFLERFIDVYHNLTSELLERLHSALLEEHKGMARDLVKMEFSKTLKARALKGKPHQVFTRQRELLEESPRWGQYFGALTSEKWTLFLERFWSAVVIDIKGYGVAWILEERRWERRVVGFESHVDKQKFIESLFPEFIDILGLIQGAAWRVPALEG